jgi:hypothetical protein
MRNRINPTWLERNEKLGEAMPSAAKAATKNKRWSLTHRDNPKVALSYQQL